MLPSFDPYYKWLGIPPSDQPADHYRLLGIVRFESDPQVIDGAADRQIAHVRTYQNSPYAAESQRLLNELAIARRCLLIPKAKAAYDQVLRSAVSADQIGELPAPILPPANSPSAAPAASKAPSATPAPAAAPASAASADPDSIIGPYEVLERSSATSLSVTYKVLHRPSGWYFTLKTLPPAAAKNREVLKRFQREIDIVTKLTHPNLIAGVDSGTSPRAPYLVMPYVVGIDLATLVKQTGPLPLDQALDLLAQACRGLEQLHSQGVYHRNLKPHVLMVDSQGKLRVTNLLLAKIDDDSELADGENLTRMGTAMGSAEYLPPEQAVDAHSADARSDIYALGCAFHYLLTGKPPYAGKSLMEKVIAHQKQPIPSLVAARPDVPAWVDHLFQRMLAKRPTDRPASVSAVLAELERPRLGSWWRRLLAKFGFGGRPAT